jgi:aryl-alcohol dehydrogenase-like predicted oxidoreductase
MEYRQLGGSGLRVPVLSLGTATFGGGSQPGSWGDTDEAGARRIVDIALDAGLTFFDTADMYAGGRAEEVLGAAIRGRRDRMLIASKATQPAGTGPNDLGSSRSHLIEALEGSLRRLGTDHLDVYYLHNMDMLTPVEETLSTLDGFVQSGKVRYLGVSNFSAWWLMKSLSVSERYGWSRYVVQQLFYSLAAREVEWELLPLGLEQNVGTVVWSPLAQSRLSGKLRRGAPIDAASRTVAPSETEQSADQDFVYDLVDVLAEVADELGRTIPQVAINWLLGRPTVSSIILGARTEDQLRENLDAIGWTLSPEQRAKLDAASERPLPYPYWHHQQNLAARVPVDRFRLPRMR